MQNNILQIPAVGGGVVFVLQPESPELDQRDILQFDMHVRNTVPHAKCPTYAEFKARELRRELNGVIRAQFSAQETNERILNIYRRLKEVCQCSM